MRLSFLVVSLIAFALSCSKPVYDQLEHTSYDNSNLKSGQVLYKVPEHWRRVAPSNPMRIAQYEIRNEANSKLATLAVYTFPGRVGGIAANISRWQGQFKDDEYKKTSHIQQFNLGELPITIVHISGTYLQSLDPMNVESAKKAIPDYALMAAVVELKDRMWFFKLIGDKSLINEERANFMAMVDSFRLKLDI